MMISKTPEADLRMQYARMIEIGIIVSLALLILAFRFFPVYEAERGSIDLGKESILVEFVEPTKRTDRPPPPPLPVIPVEVPSDELLIDVPIPGTDLVPVVQTPPPSQKTEEEHYFYRVEDPPKLIGGLASIQKHLVYPELALRAGVQGTVRVVAFVDEEGNVTRAEVEKAIGGGCDEAAVAAVLKQGSFRGNSAVRPSRCES